MLLRDRTLATNDRGPLYAEYAFAAIRQANARRLPLRLVFGTHACSVGIFIVGPSILRVPVESQFYANYPDCTLDELPTDTLDLAPEHVAVHADLFLTPDVFPCRRYSQFEDSLNRVTADQLTGVLAALSQVARDGFDGRVEITVVPARNRRVASAYRWLHRLNHLFFRSKSRLSRFYAKMASSPVRGPTDEQGCKLMGRP